MAANMEKTLIEAVRDQLRDNINGRGDYNFKLNHDQIVDRYVDVGKVSKFPFLCITSYEGDDDSIDMSGNFEEKFSVAIYGYIQLKDDKNSPLLEVSELLSDIKNAILADTDLGTTIKAYGLGFKKGLTNQDRIGICTLVVTGKFISV